MKGWCFTIHSVYVVVIPPDAESLVEAVAAIMAPLCFYYSTAPAMTHHVQATDFYWIRLSPRRITSYEGLVGSSLPESPLFMENVKSYRGYFDIKHEHNIIFALVKREYWFDYYKIGGGWTMLVPNNYALIKDLPPDLELFGLITPEGEVITHERTESLFLDEAQQLQDNEAFKHDPDLYKILQYAPAIDKDPRIWRVELANLFDEYADYLGVIVDVHT